MATELARPVGALAAPRLVLETMRPKQWIKNLFVLAGVLFSGRFVEGDALLSALTVVLAFCLVSGATYLLNDARDAETDRLNPRTANRPIARGALRPGTAMACSAVAAVLGVGLAAVVNLTTGGVLLAFMALQLSYSFGLKHVLFVDVMIIATGFVLRALAGATAVNVAVSQWLLLCTGLLALFLGLAKRRGEVVARGGASNPQRPVLDQYSVTLLDELISVVTPTTIVAYALWTVTGATSDAMMLTLPLVLYGVFRVLYLIHHRAQTTESPDVLVWRDRPLLACVLLWALAAGVISAVAS